MNTHAGVFDAVTNLSMDAEDALVTVVGLIVIVYLVMKFVEKRTLGAVVSAGLVAALAVWLVNGGIDTVRGWVGQDLNNAALVVEQTTDDVHV